MKPASDEVVIRPVAILEPAPIIHVPALSVEVVEPTEVPLSSRVIEKAPNLALDASLALRRAKSVVTKEDMDDYGKLNTYVMKRALAHSLMKVYFFIFFIYIYMPWLFVGFDGGYGRRQPVHAMGGGHCEVEITVDGCHGRQPNPVIYCSGANP